MDTTDLICEYCNKEFSTIYTLKLHQKSSKTCITLQVNAGETKYIENKDTIICEYCKKDFSVKHNLTVHLRTCKVKKEFEHIHKLIKEEKDNYLDEIEYLRKQVDIQKLEIEVQKQKIIELEQQNICNQELALHNMSEQNITFYTLEFNKMFEKLLSCSELEKSVSTLLYRNVIYPVDTIEDNFISSFINSIKKFVFCTDISRKNLVIKDESDNLKKIYAEVFIIYCFKKSIQHLNQLLKCCISHLFHLHNVSEIDDLTHLQKKLEIWNIQNQIFAGSSNKIIQKCAIQLIKNCDYLSKI